jgi:hypothetical protein
MIVHQRHEDQSEALSAYFSHGPFVQRTRPDWVFYCLCWMEHVESWGPNLPLWSQEDGQIFRNLERLECVRPVVVEHLAMLIKVEILRGGTQTKPSSLRIILV